MANQVAPKRELYIPLFHPPESFPICGANRKSTLRLTIVLFCLLSAIWFWGFSMAPLADEALLRNPETIKFPRPLRPSGEAGETLNSSASLSIRLQALLDRPLLSFETASLLNQYACARNTFGRDDVFYFEQNGARWKKYTTNQIRKTRQRLVDHMVGLIDSGVPVRWTEELLYAPHQLIEPGTPRRGVIYSAGRGAQLERLKVSLSMLRHTLHSNLPIEIFHFADELDDKDRESILEEYGPAITFKSTKIKGEMNYGIKNRAFIETPFTQFVWMDSDNIPLVDPDTLFDSVEFQQAGNVWWPDVAKDHPDNAVWRVLGQTCSDKDWTAETGQVVFDKRGNNGMNLAALHMAAYMMQESDPWSYMSWGDKDTFMAPRVFTAVGQRPRDEAGQIDEDAEFCAYANLHWGLTPMTKAEDQEYHHTPAFLHANVIKIHPEVWDEDFLGKIRRPRIDKADDVRLIRTPAKFAGVCLMYDLLGPDNDGKDGLGDGQGMLEAPLVEAWRDEFGEVSEEGYRVIEELQILGQRINHISKGEL